MSEQELPQHVQLVWHGVNDRWNLRQFLGSPVSWGECDVRTDPLGRLVLRHDSFDETPWTPDEHLSSLGDMVDAFARNARGLKLDLKQPTRDRIDEVCDRVLDVIGDRLDDDHLWFNASIESLGEAGFRGLAITRPGAILQCPIDFLTPLVLSAPTRARDLLDMLRDWGVNRFSIAWGSLHTRRLFDRLDEWGYDVNIYAVPNLEAFLQATLLLPRSLTADFNFPQWQYFGRGSGEKRAYHRYQVA